MKKKFRNPFIRFFIEFFTQNRDIRIQSINILKQHIITILHILYEDANIPDFTDENLESIANILSPYYELLENLPTIDYSFEDERMINFVDNKPKNSMDIEILQERGIKNSSNSTAFANKHIKELGFNNMRDYYISVYIYYLFSYLMFAHLLKNNIEKPKSTLIKPYTKKELAFTMTIVPQKYVDEMSLCMSELTTAFNIIEKYQTTRKGGKITSASQKRTINNIYKIISNMKLTSKQKRDDMPMILHRIRTEYEQEYKKACPFSDNTLIKFVYDS